MQIFQYNIYKGTQFRRKNVSGVIVFVLCKYSDALCLYWVSWKCLKGVQSYWGTPNPDRRTDEFRSSYLVYGVRIGD